MTRKEVCKNCGKDFEYEQRGTKRLHCTDECRVAYQMQQRRERKEARELLRTPQKRVCACGCGREFERKNGHGRHLYFSRACGWRARCGKPDVIRPCANCGKDFTVTRNKPDQAFCLDRPCQKARYSAWRANNIEQLKGKLKVYHERTRETRLVKGREYYYRTREARIAQAKEYSYKSRYGLTLEQVEALIERQGGKCAICHRTARLVVDHNHQSDVVRKMLCHRCNTVVGAFENHPHLIERWQQYIASDGEIAFS